MSLTLPVLIALLLVAGLAAGTLAGLLGVGGGILLVPVLKLLAAPLALPEARLMHVIVATSMAVVVPTAFSSARAHYQRGAVDMARLWLWAPPLAVGALGAGLIARSVPTTWLATVFALVAAAIGLRMALAWMPGAQAAAPWPALVQRGLAGVVGVLSSWMGIGGGTLSVPLLQASGLAMHRAVGTGAALGLAVSVPALAGWMVAGLSDPLWQQARPAGWRFLGYVDLLVAAIVLPCMIWMAPHGARLAHRLPARKLQRLFGLFLMVAAGAILLRSR